MVRLLITKELKEIVGTTKFAVTFGVCSVLILLSFYVGARNYQVSRAEYEAAVAENVKQMEGLTDWRRVDHRVFLPPQPLGTLVSGISNDIGRTTEVGWTGGEMHSEKSSRFGEDPVFAVFRFLDLEFIFRIVLSLFAIMFAYDTINGEKERGTLKLALANAVPRDRYLLGKLAGAFLAIAIPLILPILLGCLLLPLLGVPMSGAEWMRLGMVVLAGLPYLGVFLVLSVVMSALTRSSSSSFLWMLVIWVAAALIIPRMAVLISGRTVDVPSAAEVSHEKWGYMWQLWQVDRDKLREYWEQNPMSAEMPEERRQELREGAGTLMRTAMDTRNQKLNELGKKLDEDRRNRQLAQQRVALGIARISPVSVFSLLATNLAGTSLDLKWRYREAVRSYRGSYEQFVREKTGDTPMMMGSSDEQEEPIDPSELPAFEFQEPDTATWLTAALPDFGLLLVFNALFFAGAFVAFVRYDVR